MRPRGCSFVQSVLCWWHNQLPSSSSCLAWKSLTARIQFWTSQRRRLPPGRARGGLAFGKQAATQSRAWPGPLWWPGGDAIARPAVAWHKAGKREQHRTEEDGRTRLRDEVPARAGQARFISPPSYRGQSSAGDVWAATILVCKRRERSRIARPVKGRRVRARHTPISAKRAASAESGSALPLARQPRPALRHWDRPVPLQLNHGSFGAPHFVYDGGHPGS